MDDLAHLHSTLGKDPTSSATRAAGRGVESTVVRNILNRHLEEWTGYFAEKGVKVMLMTGAMLDGVLGYSLAGCESGSSSSSSKAALWERYNLGIRGKALSRDWMELSELIARTPRVVSPRWDTASNDAGRSAGGTYYEQRMSAMGLDIQPFEIVEPVLAHTWLASLIRKAEGERTAPTTYSRRPGLLARSSSSSVGSSASMMSSGSVTSGGSESLRSASDITRSDSDQDSMVQNERSHRIAHGRKWKEDRYGKESMKERMARASCIWLVVLPLA